MSHLARNIWMKPIFYAVRTDWDGAVQYEMVFNAAGLQQDGDVDDA